MKTELSLADAWEQEAEKWVEWARKPGFDSYWQFHRDQFLSSTVGSEAWNSRDLKSRPH